MSGTRTPLIALSIIVAASLVYLLPGLAQLFVYDRAAIGAGEPWRFLTGHMVHFSASHLIYDVLVLGIAGAIIERRNPSVFAAICLVSALMISALLWTSRPQIRFYGGLSGIACAAIVYVAVNGVAESGRWRWIFAGTVVALLLKLVWESATQSTLLVSTAGAAMVVDPLVHLVGAAAGAGLFFFQAIRKRFRAIEAVVPRDVRGEAL